MTLYKRGNIYWAYVSIDGVRHHRLMLLGRVPFRGSPSELMYQHQHAPLPLEQLKDVPQSFVVLLERLLQKDPAKRPQSPAELQALLRTLRRTQNLRWPTPASQTPI